MAGSFLKFTCDHCGAYRGIDIFYLELAGVKTYSIRLGMTIFSNLNLEVLKNKIDEWYLLKRN